jgi:membrane protease subunit HflK
MSHDHDHSKCDCHDHGHKHEPADPLAAAKAATPAAPAVAEPVLPVEDAGSQALADALKSSFAIVKFLMAGLAAVFVASGFFTVEPNELAIVLRFGKPVGTGAEQLLKPGAHWAFPYPMDEVVRIRVGQAHTVVSESGWFATTPEQEAAGQQPEALPYMRPGVDGYTLAADGNIIHARATMKYRIRPAEAKNYQFNYVDTTNLLQSVLDNALFYASSRFSADGALYNDRAGFIDLVQGRVTTLLEELNLGVAVENLDVQTSAPLDVRPAFDEVLNAQQTARTRISEAEAYARGSTNNAYGQSSTIVSEALTRSNQLVKDIVADTDAFRAQRPHYEVDPNLFRQRLLAQTMGRVLTNAQEKFFLPDRSDGRPRELRLQLSREPQKPKTETKP